MSLGVTVTNFSLGPVLIGHTNNGICTLWFGQSEVILRNCFNSRFAALYPILSSKSDFSSIVNLLERPGSGPSPVLDLFFATSFQQEVWREIQKISVGTTNTYTEIGIKLGKPKAASAVAAACYLNDIAILIPCYRVTQADKSMSGYRWGTECRRLLLGREKEAIK